jgi:hypothetical protein
MKMKKKMLILALAFMVICGADVPAALCQCIAVDPNRDRAGWAKWCTCMGGHITQKDGNPVCSGVSGSGSSGTSSGGNTDLNNAAYQLGTEIHKAIFGDPEELARQKEKQIQMLNSLDSISRDRVQSEDDMLRNAKEQARQLDDQNRNEALSTLKPATSFFGINGNPQTEKDSWTDPNVVDLRDKKGPLVIDPNTVKGNSHNDYTQPGIQQYFRSPELDKTVLQTRSDNRDKNLFPKNPDEPLINPLREPERYRAWCDSVQAALNERIIKNRTDQLIAKIQSDPELSKSKDRIVREENAGINKAYEKNLKMAQKAYEELDKKSGVDNVFVENDKKIQNSLQYKKQEKVILDNFWKEMDKAAIEARQRSLREMMQEYAKFQKRLAEKKDRH